MMTIYLHWLCFDCGKQNSNKVFLDDLKSRIDPTRRCRYCSPAWKVVCKKLLSEAKKLAKLLIPAKFLQAECRTTAGKPLNSGEPKRTDTNHNKSVELVDFNE